MKPVISTLNVAAILTAGFMLVNVPETSALENTPRECATCHDDMYARTLGNQSIHKPFIDNSCEFCHVDFGGAADNKPPVENQERNNTASPRTINWFAGNHDPATTQWFAIPVNQAGNVLYIKAEDNGNQDAHMQLDISDRNAIPRIDNSNTPPEISDIKVNDIRKGILITAAISWETDMIADSTVTFDDGEKSFKSYDGNLTTSHTMTLIGLKPDHTYTYSVTSKDVFGNMATKTAFTFSTDDALVAEPQSNRPTTQNSPLLLTGEVYKTADHYLVKVSANNAATLTVGADNPTAKKSRAMQLEAGVSDKPHGNLNIKIDRSISLCLNCHKDYKGTGSHPVDVSPTAGMIIPADYPTDRRGRITCLTCHRAHGSNLRFMLRKSHKRELCIGCHRDKDTGNPARPLMAAFRK